MVALDQLLQLSEQLRDVADSSLQGVAQQEARKSNTAFVYQSRAHLARDHRAGSRQFGDQFSGSQ